MAGHSFATLSQGVLLSPGLDLPVVFFGFSYLDLLFPLSSGEGEKKDNTETKTHNEF